MEKLLSICIIGAPLLCAIIERIRTPRGSQGMKGPLARQPANPQRGWRDALLSRS